MKKQFFFFGFFIVSLLMANPIEPAIIQQLWFEANDDLIVQIGEQGQWLEGEEITFECGGQSMDYTLPADEYPIQINLSQMLPGLQISRSSGMLSLFFTPGSQSEIVSWGSAEDCDVSALTGTQSIYQFHQTVHGEWEDYVVKSWAKSPNPGMVESYCCEVGFDLTLGVRNPQYEPLANIPVYYQDYPSLIGYTNDFGSFNIELPARRTRIRVYHPEEPDNVVYDHEFMGEPYGMNMFTVVMDYSSVDDPVYLVPIAKLSLKPTVIRAGESIVVEYGKEVNKALQMELYDIKGRLIKAYEYTGPHSWNPPVLSSGMYFLRMKDGERILDTRKFILLK